MVFVNHPIGEMILTALKIKSQMPKAKSQTPILGIRYIMRANHK